MTATSIAKLDWQELLIPLKELEDCTCCPRNCHSNRFSKRLGYCANDAGFNMASICVHKGEEPAIIGNKGICNVFFSYCNLQCIYCQNHQISKNKSDNKQFNLSLEQVLVKIVECLDNGCHAVGFVSPSHNIPQVKVIIQALHALGRKPIIVYNTNAYDHVSILRSLEGLVDVYLPDFKYSDHKLSKEYSDVKDYPAVALEALKEMYRQKGARLILNEQGYAQSGMIIRHLVLPGAEENSISVLKAIAREFGNEVYVSLMSQYNPTLAVKDHCFLSRKVNEKEYRRVVNTLYDLGFENGWVQDFESADYYNPDFSKPDPFEWKKGN